MSTPENSNARPDTPGLDGGVLAALPRTRPQRVSARRAIAREKAVKSETVATKSKPKTPRKQRAKKKPPAKPVGEPPAPRQGYEAEDEVALGNTVNPPSGVELVESIGEIAGELAGSGLAAGGRLLKDALSILHRP